MVSLRPWHSGKRVQILLRCCACDQVRFDLAILNPEALERSLDDIVLDSEEAPDGNTGFRASVSRVCRMAFPWPDRSADSVPRETPHLAAMSSSVP
jgi:hypothetical protein